MLQEVALFTGGYNWLQEVRGGTRGDIILHVVTKGTTSGYRGLQVVTNGYRGLQGVTRCPEGYKGLLVILIVTQRDQKEQHG